MVRDSERKKCMPCVVARIYIVGSLVVLKRGVGISSASERKETCINVQPLLGHPVSENYGELVSNTEEQLRIVFMYTGNLFHLHDLAI
jgi:hypothetical protein